MSQSTTQIPSLRNYHATTNSRLLLTVVPAFNVDAYLQAAVTSLLKQTMKTDILIIDDHSTDRTWDLAKKLEREHCNVIACRTRHQNSGPASLMNDAFDLAERWGYRFLARMDADDVAYPARLATQVAHLEAHPAIAACGTNCHYINDQATIIGSSTVPCSNTLIRAEARLGLRALVQGTLVFRCSQVGDIRYREDLRVAEDTDFVYRLCAAKSVSNLPGFHYGILLRADSLSTYDPRRTVEHHLYALHTNRRLQEGTNPEPMEVFLSKARTQRRVAREVRFLGLYRQRMAPRTFTSAVYLMLFDPRRALARVLRWVDSRVCLAISAVRQFMEPFPFRHG